MMIFWVNTVDTFFVMDVFVIIFDQINKLVAEFILMEGIIISFIVMVFAFGGLSFIYKV